MKREPRLEPEHIVGIVGILALAAVLLGLWALIAYNVHNDDVRKLNVTRAQVAACERLPSQNQPICIANIVGTFNTTISH